MFTLIWGHLRYFLTDFSLYLTILAVSTLVCLYTSIKAYKSAVSETKKKALLALCFTALSLVYSYSIFEAYFRYRYDESDGLGFLETTQRWTNRHVVYNNYQYRGHDFSSTPTNGKVRIGVMGDSNGFGAGIKNVNDRFSDILEKMFQENGYNVEIDNFAIPGLDTDGEIIEYERVKHFNFDLLVWQYFFNDAEEASRSAGTEILQHAQAAKPSGLASRLSSISYFFDYVYWRLTAKYSTTFIKIRNADLDQYDIPEIYGHHTQLIGDFTNQLKAENKQFVVLMIPFLYFFPNYPAQGLEIDARMNKVFTDDGAAAVVDLLPMVKNRQAKDLIVSKYDSHPNEAVHKIAAEKLYDAIVPLLEKTADGKTTLKEDSHENN